MWQIRVLGKKGNRFRLHPR